ncbi:hypothetical protein GCM10010400_45080 [Streptomyces aculeolatus]|uniref:TOMM precursor leader peptide-binding protein n=1 Tax=Streptomyces aculeolatus TaxID=270689 RepID=UPI001CECF2F9|nr:TOMM precursor leader peptide-binding protein [Streptomyces aculeolatus]
MATATGVSDRPAHYSSPTLLARGQFALHVVRRLVTRFPGGRVAEIDGQAPSLSEEPEFLIVVLSRPAPGLCLDVDTHVHRVGGAALFVVMEDNDIRVGPFVAPGRQSACFHCYLARRIQHDTQAETTHHLYAALDKGGSTSSPGFLPHHVRLTEGVTAGLVAAATGVDGAAAGTSVVVRLDTTTPAMEMQPVVGCHGCARCGARPGV